MHAQTRARARAHTKALALNNGLYVRNGSISDESMHLVAYIPIPACLGSGLRCGHHGHLRPGMAATGIASNSTSNYLNNGNTFQAGAHWN